MPRLAFLVAAGTVLILAVSVALLVPNRYTCQGGSEFFVQHRHLTGEPVYGCRDPSPGMFNHPFDATYDRRVPLRVALIFGGVVVAALLVVTGRSWRARREVPLASAL
jgi:hypothetical protein